MRDADVSGNEAQSLRGLMFDASPHKNKRRRSGGVFPSLSQHREKKAHSRDAEERGTCSWQQDILSRTELTGIELLFSRVDFNRMLDLHPLVLMGREEHQREAPMWVLVSEKLIKIFCSKRDIN